MVDTETMVEGFSSVGEPCEDDCGARLAGYMRVQSGRDTCGRSRDGYRGCWKSRHFSLLRDGQIEAASRRRRGGAPELGDELEPFGVVHDGVGV